MNVGKKIIVGVVCLGMVLSSGLVVAKDIKADRTTNAVEIVKNWFKGIIFTRLTVTVASAKGIDDIPLLRGNNMVITSPNKDSSIYLGYWGNNSNDSESDITLIYDNGDCKYSSKPSVERVKKEKENTLYYMVIEFKPYSSCNFQKGNYKLASYSFKINSSEEKQNCKKDSPIEDLLNDAYICAFEIYQRVIAAQKESNNKEEFKNIAEYLANDQFDLNKWNKD